MNSRKPDYRVKALVKSTGAKAEVGAAWKNEDGSISVILDPFIFLIQDGNLLVTLFPPFEKPLS